MRKKFYILIIAIIGISAAAFLLYFSNAKDYLTSVLSADTQTDTVFSDVNSNNLFFDAVNYVQSQGVVNGYEDGTYRPNNRINRAEFVKVIIGATFTKDQISGCTPTKTFSDISASDWFYPYICTASNSGIVGGYSDGSFKPGNYINFPEASKIIVNAFGYQTSPKEIWYQSFVEKLEEFKAIPSTICSISKNISRGEMAEMIYRLKKNITDKSSRNFFLGNPETFETTTFIKSYRLKEISDSYGIAQTKDGGYVITGHTVNPNELCGYSMFWIKTNSNGNKEWSKLWNNCSSDGYAITELTDGNYVAAGQVAGEFRTDEEQAMLEGQGDNFVVKIDGKGNPIWARTVSQQSIDTPAKLIPTRDGGFVMSGETGKLTGQPDVADVMHIMFLGNFNTNGETNWLKEIDADEQFGVKFAEQTEDDGYILIGNIKLVDENGQDVPALVKLDKNGEYEWATGLESVPLEIPNLTMNPDKSLHVGTPNKFHIPFGTFFTAEQTNDGGYIALGEFFSASLAADEIAELTKNAGKESSFAAVKVDEKGKFVWARILKIGRYLEDPVIEKTKDGGYIIMGNRWAIGLEDQKISERSKTYDEMMNEYYKKYPLGTPETPASKRDMEIIANTIEEAETPFKARNITLIKTDANFKYQWGKTIGITKNVDAYAIIPTADSGYAIAGTWHTGIKYKSMGAWVEYTEAMIIKLDANGNLGNDNGLVADFAEAQSSDASAYIVTNELNSPQLLQSYPMDNIVRTISVGDKNGVNTTASEALTYNVQFCGITAKDDTAEGTVVTKTRPQMKFEETKKVEATTKKGKIVNDELMPVLKTIFQDVKLWDDDAAGWVAYRFQRLVTKDDIDKMETEMKNLGYKIDRNDNRDFTATRIGQTLNFHFYLGNTNMGRLDVMY